jgi:hypothetical protein
MLKRLCIHFRLGSAVGAIYGGALFWSAIVVVISQIHHAVYLVRTGLTVRIPGNIDRIFLCALWTSPLMS